MYHECQVLLLNADSLTDLGPLWIIGMPFFREFYTVFDMESPRRILTAPATDDCHPTPNLMFGQAGAEGRVGGGVYKARRRAQLRRVDASKIQMPKWAKRAVKQ